MLTCLLSKRGQPLRGPRQLRVPAPTPPPPQKRKGGGDAPPSSWRSCAFSIGSSFKEMSLLLRGYYLPPAPSSIEWASDLCRLIVAFFSFYYLSISFVGLASM
ncbi:hypothetical protein CDAR_407741 [Caerostris darwini]|uniref:Uncharacterized protein n=1 Tax=Caerostris darwini TaxID=1538125 RepID=A0AAV4Q6H4_9ARAC|nr:hypothetical protein CDAR_407741 [Caerostris darwini]